MSNLKCAHGAGEAPSRLRLVELPALLVVTLTLALFAAGCAARPLEVEDKPSAAAAEPAWLASTECSAPVCPWGSSEAAGFASRDDAENWVLDQVSVFAAWAGRPAYPGLAQQLLAPWAGDFTNFGFGGKGGIDAVFTIRSAKWAAIGAPSEDGR